MSQEKPRHKIQPRDRLGGFWYFPELQEPDLSKQVVPGQHAAMMLLNHFSVAEIFSDDPETQARVFGPETDEAIV